MKYINLILFLLGGCSFLMGQSARSEPQSSYQGSYSYEVQRDFESTRLGTKNLEAFEHRAKQKIKDFVDYVNLIANQDYDLELRKHAAEMTKDLFANQQVMVKTHWLSGNRLKGYKLKDFIRTVETLEATELSITLTDIKLTKALNPIEKEYRGSFLAQQTLSLKNKGKTQKVSSYKDVEIEIVLKQVSKKFGDQEQKIWELFLGNITVLERP